MSLIVESGSIRTLRSSYRGAHGCQTGELEQLVAGSNYSLGRRGISPFQWLPESEAAIRRAWMFNHWTGSQIIAQAGTTDGTTSELFFVNTNSATATATSTATGYEGQALLATGATAANHAGWIATPSWVPTANSIAVCYASLLFPDPATATQYDFFFGFSNKTIAPGTSGTYPTDGAYWKGVGANSLPMKGITSDDAANTDNDAQATRTASATKFTLAAAASVSVELAVVIHGLASVDFWWRLPATAGNLWNTFNQATNIPQDVTLRMHLLPCTRVSAGVAFSVMDLACWWLRPTTW